MAMPPPELRCGVIEWAASPISTTRPRLQPSFINSVSNGRHITVAGSAVRIRSRISCTSGAENASSVRRKSAGPSPGPTRILSGSAIVHSRYIHSPLSGTKPAFRSPAVYNIMPSTSACRGVMNRQPPWPACFGLRAASNTSSLTCE